MQPLHHFEERPHPRCRADQGRVCVCTSRRVCTWQFRLADAVVLQSGVVAASDLHEAGFVIVVVIRCNVAQELARRVRRSRRCWRRRIGRRAVTERDAASRVPGVFLVVVGQAFLIESPPDDKVASPAPRVAPDVERAFRAAEQRVAGLAGRPNDHLHEGRAQLRQPEHHGVAAGPPPTRPGTQPGRRGGGRGGRGGRAGGRGPICVFREAPCLGGHAAW